MDKPIVGEWEELLNCQLVGYLGEDSAAPLGNLLAFRKQAGLDDLEEVKAHVILLGHLLDDVIDLRVKLL